MKKLLITFLATFATWASAGDMRLPYVSVVDGDTIRSSVQLVCPLCNVYIRIRGIDTPESNHLAKCPREKERGVAAKNFLQQLLKDEEEFMVRNIRWDKYGGRVLGDIEVNGRSVAESMIEAGHARPYSGRGRKPNWCN